MVPHLAAREAHQRLWEFSIAAPKRLLQQYLPRADIYNTHGDIRLARIRAAFPPGREHQARPDGAKALTIARNPFVSRPDVP